MKCVVCAIAKQENKYIYEWAKYHLNIGFVHLHIYDNNDINGEHIIDVFRGKEIESQVTIHDVRGMTKMQLAVYQQCYEHEAFDWCAFIDIDEFITFAPHSRYTHIEQLINKNAKHNAIVLNWLCYGDCGRLYYEKAPVQERFPTPIYPIDFIATLANGTPENYHIKTIIKKGLDIDWEEYHSPFCNPHIPSRLINIVNASGFEVDNCPWQTPDFYTAYIRHYITMSLEEYARKTKRGAADSNSQVRYKITRYFRYNRITIPKLKLVHKITGSFLFLQIVNERFKWLSISNRWPSRFLYRSFRRS